MNTKVYVGTLVGPEGERVGQYVTFEGYHNEIERLRTALQGTKDDLYSVDKAAQELGAERDRLRAALVDVVIAETLERAKRVAREGLTPTDDFHQSDAMRIQLEKEMGK